MIVTEWPELKEFAIERRSRDAMRRPLIIDGRNFLDPDDARAAGFVYEGIGRAAPLDGAAETPSPRRAGRVARVEAIILAGGKAERLGDAARGTAEGARAGRRAVRSPPTRCGSSRAPA